MGVSAHEAGFDTLFMYAWRDREKVMDMLEELTGNRVNYSANLWEELSSMWMRPKRNLYVPA